MSDEQDINATYPDAEASALLSLYELLMSSDEDEDEEQYRERQRLKRAKLLQSPAATHDDVPMPFHGQRPTVAGKSPVRGLLGRLWRPSSLSDENRAFQMKMVSPTNDRLFPEREFPKRLSRPLCKTNRVFQKRRTFPSTLNTTTMQSPPPPQSQTTTRSTSTT